MVKDEEERKYPEYYSSDNFIVMNSDIVCEFPLE
jgi:NDP-sugar pyrophosphorylase family protein